jgi:hypothetical protein
MMSSQGPYGRHGYSAQGGGAYEGGAYGSPPVATGGYGAPTKAGYGSYGGASYAAPTPRGGYSRASQEQQHYDSQIPPIGVASGYQVSKKKSELLLTLSSQFF